MILKIKKHICKPFKLHFWLLLFHMTDFTRLKKAKYFTKIIRWCHEHALLELNGIVLALSDRTQDQGPVEPSPLQEQHLRGDTGFVADLHWHARQDHRTFRKIILLWDNAIKWVLNLTWCRLSWKIKILWHDRVFTRVSEWNHFVKIICPNKPIR